MPSLACRPADRPLGARSQRSRQPSFTVGRNQVNRRAHVSLLVMAGAAAAPLAQDAPNQEREFLSRVHHFVNNIAEAPAEARVKEAAIGHVRVVQVSKQRHEALAVKCLEPCLHLAPPSCAWSVRS